MRDGTHNLHSKVLESRVNGEKTEKQESDDGKDEKSSLTKEF